MGDSWRKRYDSITSHTPTFTDHYPFAKFPDDWPVWLPRDKIASWQEHYAQIMELNIHLGGTVTKIGYDSSARKYHVLVQTSDGERKLNPTHLVLATDIFSSIPIRPSFANESCFQG